MSNMGMSNVGTKEVQHSCGHVKHRQDAGGGAIMPAGRRREFRRGLHFSANSLASTFRVAKPMAYPFGILDSAAGDRLRCRSAAMRSQGCKDMPYLDGREIASRSDVFTIPNRINTHPALPTRPLRFWHMDSAWIGNPKCTMILTHTLRLRLTPTSATADAAGGNGS